MCFFCANGDELERNTQRDDVKLFAFCCCRAYKERVTLDEVHCSRVSRGRRQSRPYETSIIQSLSERIRVHVLVVVAIAIAVARSRRRRLRLGRARE